MAEKKLTLLALLKKRAKTGEWDPAELAETIKSSYIYTPCNKGSDGNLVPILFRNREDEDPFFYFYTAPKLVGECVPQAPEYSRDRGRSILPMIIEGGAGIGLNPGHETQFVLSPVNVQLLEAFM